MSSVDSPRKNGIAGQGDVPVQDEWEGGSLQPMRRVQWLQVNEERDPLWSVVDGKYDVQCGSTVSQIPDHATHEEKAEPDEVQRTSLEASHHRKK